MASTSLLPNVQQQPVEGEGETNSQGVSSGGSSSTGSIGPFFAVISVLTVLAIISCMLGRYCRRGAVETPLDSINGGGCLGRVKQRWHRYMAGEVEAGAKVMAFGEDKNHVMAQDPPQP
ncbi:hypothetical protein Dsin_006904 [Dipteronia sinensis]|uniref:Uncharacterized protein n=1 Tax=Dipteronia sinensis TaxID=43782 RepID=A0AAE0AZJ6_9ROSI|nr:hypothetical protein Dsin_006904 [Dipteronia sinensis]